MNPIAGTKPYPRKAPNVTILTKEKLKLLLAAASKSAWYLEILLGVFCGLRKGEIQGLKFSDFGLQEKTVSIQRQITSNPVILKGSSRIASYEVIERPPKTENSVRILRVPLIKISALLGYASVNTTFEYYCDTMDEDKRIISFMNGNFIPEEN